MSSARMARTFGRAGSAAGAVVARHSEARRLSRNRGAIREASEVVAAPTECNGPDVGRNQKAEARSARPGPRLEPLGDRLCPAVEYIKVGHTLTVLGDAGNNTIQVFEEPTSFLGFSVTDDGQTFITFPNTTHLVFKGGLGDDRVTYDDGGL